MIVLAGATGLVGRAVATLLPTGRRPWTELSRLPRAKGWDEGPRRVATLDLCDAEALAKALPEAAAIIHVAGVAPGLAPTRADHELTAMRALLEVARARRVERFLFVSACGASPESGHAWLRAKGEAEALLRASGLPFVIVRASLVSAPDAAWLHALQQVVRAKRKLRLPLLRAGRMQPIASGDLAIALVTALDDHRALGKVIDVGRAPSLSLEELCDVIARRIGARVEWSRLPFVGEALDEALASVASGPLTDAAGFVRLFALLEAAPLALYERLLPMKRAPFAEELREYPWGAPPPRPGDPLPTIAPQPQDATLPLFIPGESLRDPRERAKLPPAMLGRVDPFGRGVKRDERSQDETRPDGEPNPPIKPA